MLNKEGQCCYFSQISTLAKSQEQSLFSLNPPNTQFYVSSEDKSINFLSKGGNQYFLPLDVELVAAFPLAEGLLLGWGRDEFNYSVLLNHPLGTLAPLGTYNQTLASIDPWTHSQEEIIHVSTTLPLLVSYNSQLMRHCVYLLKANLEADCESLQNQNFNLSAETSLCKLVAELLYEENIKEEKAKQCEIIRGNFDGELLLCLLSDTTLRILEINLCEQAEKEELKSRNLFSSLKLVQIVQKVQQIACCNLIENASAQAISIVKQRLKQHNNFSGYLAYQIISKQYIPQNMIVYHQNSSITLLNGSKIVINYEPNEALTDISQYKCAPQLSDELLSTIVQTLKTVLESQQYLCILKDILTICLSQQHQKPATPQVQFAHDTTEFDKFVYLMVFYLKLCSSKNDGAEHIAKKVKSSASSQSARETPQKQESKAFSQLLNSNFHRQRTNYQFDPPPLKEIKHLAFTYHMALETFSELQEKLLYVFHLLYQDLTIQSSQLANRLLYLLYAYALNLDSEYSQNYADYYLRIDPTLQRRYQSDPNIPLLPTIRPAPHLGQANKNRVLPPNPLDLPRWYSGILTQNHTSFPILFKTTKELCRILQASSKKQLIHISTILSPDFQDFQPLPQPPKNKPLTLFHQKLLSSDYSTNYLRVKQEKQATIQKLQGASLLLYLLSARKWTPAKLHRLPLHYRLPILEMINTLRNSLPNDLVLSKSAFQLIDRMDIYMNRKLYSSSPTSSEFKKYVNSILSAQIKSMHSQYNDEQLAPAYDQHSLSQVRRLFDYARDLRIKTKMTEHIPEERLDQDAPNVLLKLLNKKLAMFIGLGALTYGTSDHFITDQIKFPSLNLSGVLQQNSLKLTIDSTREDYVQLTQWPEFHLGVALALQLSKKLKGLSQESLRTWIFYQKPQNPSNIHGGFMLGLGFLGYLNSFNQIDLYQLLTQNHESTSVGVLLGIGASRIGTCDEPTQKSLTVHIPSLIPSIYDLELPSNVSTSALCALGFLFMQSGNRNFTEVALGLIGRKPHSDRVTDREGYSVAAGIALGLINLGKGSVWRRELQIEDRLIRFVQGGKVMNPPQSSLSTNFVQNENQISSIKEGNMVNVHITCPAALIALSLIFLQTNLKHIVDQLAIPNSFSSLESCNPNHIILKSFSSHMIMWDTIPTTKESLYATIPELIRYLFEQPLKRIHQKYYIVYNVEVIDFMTVSMIYSGMIAGALLAIGVKYAGSHDQVLKRLMLDEVNFLLKLKISQNEFANDPDNKCAIDQYSFYTNVVNGLQGLALLMAGSFDAEVLALAKQIRSKMEHASIWHFGFHQAVKMAIGMLFLGKGGFSFKKNQKAISMLYLSLFPYYPSNPGDNRQFLQPLRWSYVMAIQPKIFKIIDVRTQKEAIAKVKLQEANGTQRIILEDANYCSLNMEFPAQKKTIQTIYVQTKVLGQGNSDLLSQESNLRNMKTLLQIGDLEKIEAKLRHLVEWKYLQSFSDKMPFLELLQTDNAGFLPVLHILISQKKQFQHLPILSQFYNRYNQYILKSSLIQRITTQRTITNQQLHNYIYNVNFEGEPEFYQWLVINNLPLYYEFKQISKVAKQIPQQILEFYLYRSYPEVSQSQLKLIVKAIQQHQN